MVENKVSMLMSKKFKVYCIQSNVSNTRFNFPSRDKQSVLQYVKDFEPPTEGQQIRILLHGPVGAGKSSFINSVQSILHGRMYAQALVDNTGLHSFSKKV